MSTHRKAERVSILELLPGGCARESKAQYKMGIIVPSVPPTDLTASSVCRVKYEFQVRPLALHISIYSTQVRNNGAPLDLKTDDFFCNRP